MTRRPRGVVRLGISLDPELQVALDRWVLARNSKSRSDALRFLIRQELGEQGLADPEADAVGALTVLYRHDSPSVLRRLVAAQHRWGGHIRSSTHVHLEGGACVESMILVGRRREVERIAEDLRGVKGVSQGGFTVTSPAVASGATGHRHPHPSGRAPADAAI